MQKWGWFWGSSLQMRGKGGAALLVQCLKRMKFDHGRSLFLLQKKILYCLVMVWWGTAQLSWFLWFSAIPKASPWTQYPQYAWERIESPRKVAHAGAQCGSLWFRAACHVLGHCVSIDLSLHLLSIYAGFAFVLNIAQTGALIRAVLVSINLPLSLNILRMLCTRYPGAV